jgi:hypothetical protein
MAVSPTAVIASEAKQSRAAVPAAHVSLSVWIAASPAAPRNDGFIRSVQRHHNVQLARAMRAEQKRLLDIG